MPATVAERQCTRWGTCRVRADETPADRAEQTSERGSRSLSPWNGEDTGRRPRSRYCSTRVKRQPPAKTRRLMCEPMTSQTVAPTGEAAVAVRRRPCLLRSARRNCQHTVRATSRSSCRCELGPPLHESNSQRIRRRAAAIAWIRQTRFAQRPGGSRLCIAMDGGVSSPAAVRPLSPTSRRARPGRATTGSALAAAPVSLCLCHAVSSLAALGGTTASPG